MRSTLRGIPLLSILAVTVVLGGCHKKVAKVTPPPPPPPAPAPTATIAASPDVIHPGQSTTLTWHTQNANDVDIEGLGTVSASGTRAVSPGYSTTYNLIARGPGGSADASTRVTVNPLPAHTSSAGPSEADLFAQNVKDVYFDFDQYNIRPDETSAASADATFLAQHPSIKVTIEGHCDDRGSEEYNIALGQSRANTLKNDLQRNGVNAARIDTMSYGKEHPFCSAEDEGCWQENRRDHIVP
ncbi:MAG TPA: peptidoglycan-associated lipoprotein Pal, partial [Terriglobales bacterium]|nr:peptidoglycan-associated lipoprotein Pal [Terriglobales bacterium]